jgi:hypothetical protein
MKRRLQPLAAWLRAARTRHRARSAARHAGALSDHLRRDAGLPPRGPSGRAIDRCRYGLPV